jgi:type IV pilus assembly protein PilQ
MFMPCGTVTAAELLSSDKPLSIKVRDVDIRDVLRIIAEEYGLNIVIGKGVEGRISYEIENTTLHAGFDAILKSNGLGYIIENNIIRVDDLKTLRLALNEELEIHRAQQQLREARKLEKPLQTKEITLNYIGDTLSSSRQDKARNLKEILEPLLSHNKEKGVDRGANIQLLKESNTLVVTDVEDNLKDIEAVAKALDRPPAQVRIEARVVEMFHGDSLGLGIQWGGKYEHTSTDGRTQAIGGRRTGTTGGTILGDSRNMGVDLPILGEFAPLGTIGYTFLNNLSLDIELQAMETKGKLQLISKPSLQVFRSSRMKMLRSLLADRYPWPAVWILRPVRWKWPSKRSGQSSRSPPRSPRMGRSSWWSSSSGAPSGKRLLSRVHRISPSTRRTPHPRSG